MPTIEIRSRRVGGATYQVPVEVPARRVGRRSASAGFLAGAARPEDDDRAALGRIARRVQRPGKHRREARGYAPASPRPTGWFHVSLVTAGER